MMMLPRFYRPPVILAAMLGLAAWGVLALAVIG